MCNRISRFMLVGLLLSRFPAQELHAVPPPDPVPTGSTVKPSSTTTGAEGASTVKEVVEVIQQTAEEILNHSKALYHEFSRREKLREQRLADEKPAAGIESGEVQPLPASVQNAVDPREHLVPPAGPLPAAHAAGEKLNPSYQWSNQSYNMSISEALGYVVVPGDRAHAGPDGPSIRQATHNEESTPQPQLFVDVTVPGLGTVRGQSAASRPSAGVDRWLGIPYALPPTGARRWMPPVPIRTWNQKEMEAQYNTSKPLKADGTAQGGAPMDGTLFGNSCMPAAGAGTWMPPEPSISEDCLFLNVWTPAGHAQAVREGRASLLPVVLWIHGGAFFMGSGANPSTSPPPDVFVRAANVIYVTFNYRLGVLGWLVSSALPDNGGLQGIQDQLLSMAWVRDHIRAFGGDPSQVTLQGESAGAISICVHLALPAAKGLFKKAILQSGICAFPFEDIATAYAGKERLSKAVGCHRTVTAEDGTGGTDMRPARAPPVSTITRSQPDAPDSASMSSSGTPVEGGKAILHDSIIQLPVEQDDGEAHTSGAAGMKVEKEAHELSEARQRSIQSHAGTASDTPSFTSWQAASLWVRARMLWPWSMEQDREEGPAGRNNAHATEGRTQTASSGKVSPSTNEPTPSTSHSTGGMLRRLVSSLSHSIRGLQHGAAASVPASSSPEGAPVHNLHEFLKPATANPYSTVHYVGSESDSIVSLGRPRTWSAWMRASVSALSRFTENHAAPRQSMPAKRVGRQGDQSGRVAYKPPVWSKKQLIRDSDELECMRTLSAETMVAAMTARRGIFFYEGETWGPVVDGILLPDHPLRMIKTGMADVSNVDILYGHNKDEASLFVLFAWPFLVSRQLIWDFIHATLGPEHAQGVWDTYIEGETHPHVRAAMPAITTLPTPITAGGHPSVSPSPQSESTEGRPGGKAEDTLRVKAVRMLNDYWKCASFSVAEQLSQHGARVRVYQFIHTPSYLSNWFQWLGAFHGAELDFALAAFTQHEPQPAEARLAAHMARLWGEFVTGKRLRVQEVPGASRTNSTGTEGSTNETTVYTYTFVADQSNLASHPPLAVHPGPYPGTSHSQYLANALLGKGKEPLLVSEAHVDPAMIHVNDVEWPLYAPPGRSALSTEPVDTPVQGLAVGHDRGVCLQLQAEPSFTLSPRGTCRPAECALWDATLSHGFIMRMPPQMKEPLVSQLTNVWVPKALTWLSKHLPHLNVLGVMLVMFVLLLAAWPAGREVSRRWQNNMRAVLHSDKAAMAPSTTPYRWGLPAHSSYGFRPAASGNKGLPGAPPSRVSSFLHHVNEDVKHVLPRHHSHTHREHMPGSVGVYGPTVEMAEFMEHCDDSECGDSEDDAQEGTAPNQRTPRGVGRLRGRSLRSKVAAKLRQRIPHPLQQDHDLAQVEAAALSYAQVGGHAVWLALSCIGQLCWGFSAGLYAVLTEQCRRPRHRGRLLNMQTG